MRPVTCWIVTSYQTFSWSHDVPPSVGDLLPHEGKLLKVVAREWTEDNELLCYAEKRVTL